MATVNCCVEKPRTKDELLKGIINSKSITTLFHPICSVTKKQIFGVEALSRGVSAEEIVNPLELLNYALNSGKVLELDRIFRSKAVENFSAQHTIGKEKPLLFLNLNTSVLMECTIGSNSLADLVASYGIEPGQVVIELLESEIENEDLLLEFSTTYRKMGFHLALDDVGAGCSNLNRMVALQPSIVKIDRFLIKNVHEEFYKRSVLKGIIDMAHDIGAMVITEGVETELEAMVCLECGADFLQGFYFCQPMFCLSEIEELCENKIKRLAASFRKYSLNELNKKKKRVQKQIATLNELVNQITLLGNLDYDAVFKTLKFANPNLECFYILNEHGEQLTPTIGLEYPDSNSFYKPADIGFDHGVKRYVISLQAGLTRFISDHYLSLATGRVCQTLSELVNWKGVKYILCIDFTY